jgi:hypothetical protein
MRIRNGDGKIRTVNHYRAAAVCDGNLTKMVDDPRSKPSVRDRRCAAPNPNCGNRRPHAGSALMAELASNEPKDAFGERSH